MKKFTIFDCETSGLSVRYDYPLTVAFQTFDEDFNLIDQLSIGTGIRPGVIPSPYAIGTNKLLIEDLRKSNLSFFEMSSQIFQYIEKHTPHYIFGFNSLFFDEEMLRTCFYQNLLPCYPTQTLGNQRGDLLLMARAASVFTPGTVKVSLNAKNRPDFRLESLSDVNNLLHSEKHTALSDVIATAALFRQIKDNDPIFFNSCLNLTSKKEIDSFVFENKVFCYAPTVDNPMVLTSISKPDSSTYILFDLSQDPHQYLDFTAKDLTKIIRKKESPFYFVKNNRQPIFLDKTYRKFTNCDLSEEEVFIRARMIEENKNFKNSVNLAFTLTQKEWPQGQTTEEKIYSGFPDTFDQNLMKQFHKSSWNQRVEIASQFEDPKYAEIADRIIYEQNPSLLEKHRIDRVEKILHDRLFIDENRPRNIDQAISEFENYKEANPGVPQVPLVQYEEFLKSI